MFLSSFFKITILFLTFDFSLSQCNVGNEYCECYTDKNYFNIFCVEDNFEHIALSSNDWVTIINKYYTNQWTWLVLFFMALARGSK